MKRLGVVMVRCPKTGRELSTGIEMDAAGLERLPDIRSRIECPVCRVEHVWSIVRRGSITHLLSLRSPGCSLTTEALRTIKRSMKSARAQPHL